VLTAADRDLLAAVRRRLAAEPETVLPALRLLADPEAMPDPEDDATISLAKTLNAHRMVALLRDLRARSYTTAQVGELLGGVSRQAVSQRAANRRLMSIEISRHAYFPEWQFVDGRPVAGLSELIAALDAGGYDTFSADALMRTPLPEERGRTPADLLAAGDVVTALHYVQIAGGGF
jgi:hypothetical protein